MKRVLFLGPDDSEIYKYLGTRVQSVAAVDGRLDDAHIYNNDLVVSHGYRHILTARQIKSFKCQAVNCHISFLPWNRGADPNFWSWFDDTPKGVTIHEIDSGVDTGPILARREVVFGWNHTLKSSYEKLQKEMLYLFIEWFSSPNLYETGSYLDLPKGSFHTKSDLDRVRSVLTNGWDTPVKELKLG